jgi:predicted phage terminase large subunit-like protein
MRPGVDNTFCGCASGNLLAWCAFVDASYRAPKHIRYLADKLQSVERGDIKRLIVEMPPRHGKSQLCSIRFPAWFLGRNPDSRIIMASHTAQLAQIMSRKVRNEFKEWGCRVFDTTIADDSSAADRWDLKGHAGGLFAVGVGGSTPGHGANCLIIDDTVRNAEHAHSKLQRDKTWDWYQHDARTRLHPGGRIVVVGTRWHEDDLMGRLLQSDAEKWHRIRFPAIAEGKDALGRKEGQVLWPDQFSQEELKLIKRSVGSYVWGALYQQRPTLPDGGIVKIKQIRFYRELPPDATDFIQSWDLSFKDNDDSSFIVGQVWARDRANRYLVDQYRRRCNFTDTIRAIFRMYEKWPMATTKLVEDKANGPAIISTLRNDVPGIIAVQVRSSKESRLIATQPLFEAGNVYVPDPGLNPWVNDYTEELIGFPHMPHDDQVDATTMALAHYEKNKAPVTFKLSEIGRQSNPWKV